MILVDVAKTDCRSGNLLKFIIASIVNNIEKYHQHEIDIVSIKKRSNIFKLFPDRFVFHEYTKNDDLLYNLKEGTKSTNLIQTVIAQYIIPYFDYTPIQELDLENGLVIHIRSGDVFVPCSHVNKKINSVLFNHFIQPPLEFYESIIANVRSPIYLVSEDKKNPVIDILLNTYKHIRYVSTDVLTDFKILLLCKELVMSTSELCLYAAICSPPKRIIYCTRKNYLYLAKSQQNVIHYNYDCYYKTPFVSYEDKINRMVSFKRYIRTQTIPRITTDKPVYLVTPNNDDPNRYYFKVEDTLDLGLVTHLTRLSDQTKMRLSEFYDHPFYIACNGVVSPMFTIQDVNEFIVCSYGGCGSTMLHKALKKYGVSHHVHSRCPPEKLEYISWEHFNGTQIPPEQLHRFKVIYIYRNPTDAILSWARRFRDQVYVTHLKHIESPHYTPLEQMASTASDLYGIQAFYRNYTTSSNRNYNIYCVRYEDLFKYQDQLSQWLGIGPLDINIVEHKHESIHTSALDTIYSEVYAEMKQNDPIFIT